MDQARMAHTEAAFREVNEAIAGTAARFDAEEVDFICECADPQCADRINVDLAEYEEVRSDATHFLLAPGHHEPRVERVVERTGEFDVVEKVVPRMRRIVRRLNPRAAPAT
jgi:hypothetical protein